MFCPLVGRNVGDDDDSGSEIADDSVVSEVAADAEDSDARHSRHASYSHSRHSSNGFASRHSILGHYLDLDSELEYADVSMLWSV